MTSVSPNATHSPQDSTTGPMEIDTLLLSALNDPNHRRLILKLDLELQKFIETPMYDRFQFISSIVFITNDLYFTRPGFLEFPPLASFQRLIIHRVASYFRLAHIVGGNKNMAKRPVILHRLRTSRMYE